MSAWEKFEQNNKNKRKNRTVMAKNDRHGQIVTFSADVRLREMKVICSMHGSARPTPSIVSCFKEIRFGFLFPSDTLYTPYMTYSFDPV